MFCGRGLQCRCDKRGILDDCPAGLLGWSSEEISGSDVSESSGMTAVDCTLEESLCEKTDAKGFQLDERIQNDVVCVEVGY